MTRGLRLVKAAQSRDEFIQRAIDFDTEKSAGRNEAASKTTLWHVEASSDINLLSAQVHSGIPTLKLDVFVGLTL